MKRPVEVIDDADVVAVYEHLSVALFEVDSYATIAGSDAGHDIPGARVTVRAVATAIVVAIAAARAVAVSGGNIVAARCAPISAAGDARVCFPMPDAHSCRA